LRAALSTTPKTRNKREKRTKKKTIIYKKVII